MIKSCDVTTEASKARLPYPMKKYAASNDDIPLKKNWSETWCTLPYHFDKVSEDIYNFEVRPDDVYVVTFMKCGTTWMQECAWLLMNDLDFEKSKQSPVMVRSPFVDFGVINPNSPNPVERLNNLLSPRVIKSHMPVNLLPVQVWKKKPKIIYVARNAKDVIVSSFHFLKDVDMWRGDNMEDLVNDYIDDEIIYTQYWAHVMDFWKMRNESFIFFVTYEEMKRDLAGVVQRLCIFLERPLLTEEELAKIVEHLSFDNMKSNKQLNLTNMLKKSFNVKNENFEFMRRGIIGAFKDELTPELQEKIDKWTQECLSKYDLTEEDIFGKL